MYPCNNWSTTLYPASACAVKPQKLVTCTVALQKFVSYTVPWMIWTESRSPLATWLNASITCSGAWMVGSLSGSMRGILTVQIRGNMITQRDIGTTEWQVGVDTLIQASMTALMQNSVNARILPFWSYSTASTMFIVNGTCTNAGYSQHSCRVPCLFRAISLHKFRSVTLFNLEWLPYRNAG